MLFCTERPSLAGTSHAKIETGPQYSAGARVSRRGDQYRKRFRHAAIQLARAKLRGIVAVSFDFIRPGDYPGLTGNSADEIAARIPSLLEGVVDPLKGVTWDVARGRPVLGLLACVVAPAVVPAQNQIGRAAGTLLRIIEPNADPTEKERLIKLVNGMARPNI